MKVLSNRKFSCMGMINITKPPSFLNVFKKKKLCKLRCEIVGLEFMKETLFQKRKTCD